jgi:hypothetical protein
MRCHIWEESRMWRQGANVFESMNMFVSFQDKTFGLKNKKGSKQQKYIKTVTQQVKQGNVKSSRVSVKLGCVCYM